MKYLAIRGSFIQVFDDFDTAHGYLCGVMGLHDNKRLVFEKINLDGVIIHLAGTPFPEDAGSEFDPQTNYIIEVPE